MAPNRIDLIRAVKGTEFETAWARRERAKYRAVEANWIDLDSLLAIKSQMDHPRHQEDARVLRQLKQDREAQDQSEAGAD